MGMGSRNVSLCWEAVPFSDGSFIGGSTVCDAVSFEDSFPNAVHFGGNLWDVLPKRVCPYSISLFEVETP